MRPIDADAFRRCVLNGKPIGLTICQYSKSDILAMIRDQPTIALPPNLPLTLEELREMDGEPVWVEHCNGGEYVIVAWNIHDEISDARQARLDAGKYGIDCLGGWLAYRRKPEEGP